MFNTKFLVLDNLSKRQRASFFSYIKIFIRKNSSFDICDLWTKFIEEMSYYEKINSPKFTWLGEFLCDENFEKDVKYLMKRIVQQMVYKESQKPYIEKRKANAKAFRKKVCEMKQSHQRPTEKQISFYNSLCDKKGLEKINLDDKSKLDLKNMIAELLEN